jgi:hypothetical protein
MATSQLSLFNDALGLLGARSIATVNDATEPARVLLALWDHTRAYCIEQGHWKFAEREAVLSPSTTEVPTYGLANAFAQPTDYVRLNEMAADEYYSAPIFQINQRNDHWYCDLETLYIRYVSNDAAFGYDVTRWPASFELYYTLYLATRAAPRVAPSMKLELIKAGGNLGLETAKYNALSKDAVNGPTKFLPQGAWAASRSNRQGGRNSRKTLYGS